MHPDGQQIKTNQQNILIRSLTLRNKKGDSSSKDVKSAGATESSRKRYCYCFKVAYVSFLIKILFLQVSFPFSTTIISFEVLKFRYLALICMATMSCRMIHVLWFVINGIYYLDTRVHS